MTIIIILAILSILAGATLSVTGSTIISPTSAQTPTGDNASLTGNMTGGNVTGGNMTGSISSFDEGGGTNDESSDESSDESGGSSNP